MDTKKVNITLTLEAYSLHSKENPQKAEIEAGSSLSDNNKGCAPGGKIEDFQSSVEIDQGVSWSGNSKDPDGVDKGYSVKIDSIVYKKGVNFFETEILPGKGGKVTATVKNDPKLIGEFYEYTIKLSILKGENDCKYFIIDPKLKGNPKIN